MTYLLLAFLAFALGLAAGWYAGVHLTCHALVDDLATLDAERSQLDADRRQLDRDREAHLALIEAELDSGVRQAFNLHDGTWVGRV